MNDAAFLAAFEDCSLPEFHHRDHVRAAWCYLRDLALIEALERYSTALQRLARSRGKPEIYHATITWAYLFLIHQRMQPQESWPDFEVRNADLLIWRPSVLERYYRPATIASERARRGFILPDACMEDPAEQAG